MGEGMARRLLSHGDPMVRHYSSGAVTNATAALKGSNLLPPGWLFPSNVHVTTK